MNGTERTLYAQDRGSRPGLFYSDSPNDIRAHKGSTGNGWANNYSGDVDEVAIYNTALTPTKIANHYVIGRAGTTALTVARSGSGNVTINWPAGTVLQESSTVTGTFTTRPGNPVSPLTIPASGTMFYRWALQ